MRRARVCGDRLAESNPRRSRKARRNFCLDDRGRAPVAIVWPKGNPRRARRTAFSMTRQRARRSTGIRGERGERGGILSRRPRWRAPGGWPKGNPRRTRRPRRFSFSTTAAPRGRRSTGIRGGHGECGGILSRRPRWRAPGDRLAERQSAEDADNAEAFFLDDRGSAPWTTVTPKSNPRRAKDFFPRQRQRPFCRGMTAAARRQ